MKGSTVKITNNLGIPTGVGSPRSVARSPAASATGATSSAEVQLSSTAQLRGNSEQMPVDAARIQAIRQAIAEGRFSINAGAIADGLLQTARDLLSGQPAA